MRRILRTILFLAVLCLTGCSSEDPQSVAFPEESVESPSCGWTYNLNIEANCPWRISSESPNIRIEPSSGEGSSTSVLHLPENKTYDDITFRITVISEDGTSSDILTIVQKAAIGLYVQGVSQIPEGGASIDVPVKTNDRITSVETPEWVTLTSSRTLTDYTYTFKVESNKTGAVRKGTIRFNGSETESSIEVTQDSYGPSGIQTNENIPLCTTERTLSVPFEMIPEYADPTKLTVKAKSNCTAEIKDGCLVMKPKDYGIFTAAFCHKATELHTVSSELFPKKPLNMGSTVRTYLGQTKELVYTYYSKDYILESNSPEIIRTEGNRNVHAVGLGSGTVTASHPGLGTSSSVTVNVEPYLLKAETTWTAELKGGLYEVSICAELQCAATTTVDNFYLTDPDGRIIIFNEGKITKEKETVYISMGNINVRFDAGKYGSITNAMKQYKISVNANVNGTYYSKTAEVNGPTV